MRSWSLAVSTGGQVGFDLNPGGCSGAMCLVEWKSHRAPSMIHGTARLQRWVVGVVSSYSQQWRCIPLICVSRQSPYPGIQTCGLRHSRCLPRVFPLHHITSLDATLNITVMGESDSTLDYQNYSTLPLYSSPLVSYLNVYPHWLRLPFTLADIQLEDSPSMWERTGPQRPSPLHTHSGSFSPLVSPST